MTNTKELEERLRERSENWAGDASHLSARLDRQAADALASMRAENERLVALAYWDGPESPTWQSQALEEGFKRAELEREADRLRAQRDEAVKLLRECSDFSYDLSKRSGLLVAIRTFLNNHITGEHPVQEGESDG